MPWIQFKHISALQEPWLGTKAFERIADILKNSNYYTHSKNESDALRKRLLDVNDVQLGYHYKAALKGLLSVS